MQRLAEIGGLTPAPGFDGDEFAARFSRPPIVGRRRQVGIMLAHGQRGWPLRGQPTLFDDPVAADLAQPDSPRFRLFYGEEQFAASAKADLSGLVVGSPRRASLSADFITEVEDWGCEGGRLLLLGYELGDRHHAANRGELAQRFGVHPMPDIVGPPNAGSKKLYDELVTLLTAEADPHPFTKELGPIVLRNVQTAMLQPGATAWLRVGRNVVYRPTQASVQYQPDGSRPRAAPPQPLGDAGPNFSTQRRTVSYETSRPRWASRSSTSRWLSVNRTYNQTACWTTRGGNWWRA